MPAQSTIIADETQQGQSSVIGGYPAIIAVGINDAVTQYQNGVVIQLSDFTETIVAVTINGVSCDIDSQTPGSVTVNMPGNLTTGNYAVIVSGATETASRDADYTQTHSIACPAFGTTIPGISATDPDRSLIYGVALDLAPYVEPPELTTDLQFKSPHTAWTAGNINLPLSEVIEPSGTAVDGDVIPLTLAVLKSDGSTSTPAVNVRIYVDVTHILRLTSAAGTALQAVTYTFPNGWIITDDNTLKLQDVVITGGEGTISQDNIVGSDIGLLTLGEFALVLLFDVSNNLGAICPSIEVEAA